jgi:hypothetical protein
MTSQTGAQERLDCVAQEKVYPDRSAERNRALKIGLSILAVVVIVGALIAWMSKPNAEAPASLTRYRPALGEFAATAPLIPGYNAPASTSTDLSGIVGEFAATAPLIPGYNVPASMSTDPSGIVGEFAATAPLIPGYNVPASMPTELWGIIHGRDGFSIYDGR